MPAFLFEKISPDQAKVTSRDLTLWAWIVSVILLLGGEVVSHIQEMMIEGTPREEIEESHLDRSPLKRLVGS